MNPRTSSSVDEVRTRQVTWTDPMVALQRFVGMSREEFLAEFTSGGIPKPPIGELLGFEVLEAEPGRAVLAFPTAEYLCNPFGVVAGGVAATIMDAAMWVAFQTSLPGQTLVTEMWREGPQRVVYQVRVKENGKLCISNAAAELFGPAKASL